MSLCATRSVDRPKAKALLPKAGIKPGTVLTYTYSPGSQGQFAGLIL